MYMNFLKEHLQQPQKYYPYVMIPPGDALQFILVHLSTYR